MSVQDLGGIAQLGFAAVMAILIWRAYDALSVRVLAVVDKNSDALQRVASSIDQNIKAIDRLAHDVDVLWEHVRGLEICQHGDEGHASCPYLHKERG